MKKSQDIELHNCKAILGIREMIEKRTGSDKYLWEVVDHIMDQLAQARYYGHNERETLYYCLKRKFKTLE